jgi:hypothetical protein
MAEEKMNDEKDMVIYRKSSAESKSKKESKYLISKES